MTGSTGTGAATGSAETGSSTGGGSAGIDNGLIAYTDAGAQGHQQIFTITAQGGDRTQLTFDGDNFLPSWSPDGTRMVYVSKASSTAENTLWIMDANGDHKQSLLPGDAPDWGHDDRIVFCRGEIYITDATASTPVQVTSSGNAAGNIHPSWSPDGSQIAYVRIAPQDPANDDASNGCPALAWRPQVRIIDADGGNDQALTTSEGFYNVDDAGQVMNSAFDANASDWSHSGDEIVFWSGQESCSGQVWKIHADGSGRTQLTHAPLPSANDDPEWAPDGTKILFSTSRSGRDELWMMNADGSDQHFVAKSKAGPGPGDASWQPVPR